MTEPTGWRPADDIAADVWRELFPDRFPQHWDAILTLLGQDETYTLWTLLAGYKATASSFFNPGDMVSVNPTFTRQLEPTSGWYRYLPTLTTHVGTVLRVGFHPRHNHWAAAVRYDHPQLTWSNGTTYHRDEPAVFHIPVGDLRLVGATEPPAGDAAWDGGLA